jgi:ferric-dicitrate binding protein FerR (iron transport regulator)
VTDGPGLGPGPGEPVGSVGEEAAKLLHALQDWAKDGGADAAATAATAASGAASAWEQVNEHLATGGDDCRYCPVCQVISAVRQTSPEVREHLAHAAASLAQAAAGLLATHVPDRSPTHQAGSKGESNLEKIDLDDGMDD